MFASAGACARKLAPAASVNIDPAIANAIGLIDLFMPHPILFCCCRPDHRSMLPDRSGPTITLPKICAGDGTVEYMVGIG